MKTWNKAKMKCAKHRRDPCNGCTGMLTHRHTVQQHHTAPVQATHTHTNTQPNTTYNATAPVHKHTYTPATSKQPTNHATNQPTNQPAKLTCPTTNQPTQQPTKQPENQQPTNQQARYRCKQRGGGPITWEAGGQSIPLTHKAQLLTVQQYSTQPQTTDTHGGEEGRSNTPTSWCHCVRTSYCNYEVNRFKKQKHTCKKVMDTRPNLKHNKHRSPTPQTTAWKAGGGGGLIARHSGGVCAVLVVGVLLHASHQHRMLCVVSMPNCVCGGGGGAHRHIHAPTMFVSMCVYHGTPPTHTLVSLAC